VAQFHVAPCCDNVVLISRSAKNPEISHRNKGEPGIAQLPAFGNHKKANGIENIANQQYDSDHGKEDREKGPHRPK